MSQSRLSLMNTSLGGRNVIYESAKFNSRRQQDGETVDQFVTALHTLAENCSYGQLCEEMI